jgi:molybdopterin-containing oxidoreductase family iron-sulfur binding subunit
LRYSREFIARRRVTENNREMNRLYVIETTPSNTGAIADHTWTVKPSEFEGIARALASVVAFPKELWGGLGPPYGGSFNQAWIDAVTKDLSAHKGASIVIAGENQPPIIHALAHAMNNALGNVGKTVFYTDPLEVNSVDQR